MRTLLFDEWKVHGKCWGMFFSSGGLLSYQSDGHHCLWARYLQKGGQVGTTVTTGVEEPPGLKNQTPYLPLK